MPSKEGTLPAEVVTAPLRRLRSLVSTPAWLLLCLAAGIALAHRAGGAVILNTDSSAPISQLLLLAQGRVAGLTELRLARIPSFFPDLFVLWGWIRLGGAADPIGLLLARYAIVMATLLIGLQAWIVARVAGLHRWLALLYCTGGTFLFLSGSSLYGEAVGLILTPVHHGGGLISSLVMLALLAELVREDPQHSGPRVRRTLRVAMVVLAGVGTLSNTLFLFTGVLPVVIALAAARLTPAGRRGPVHSAAMDHGPFGREGNFLAAMAGASAIGWFAGRWFNLQCSLGLRAFPASNLFAEYRDSPLFLFATASGLLLLASALLARRHLPLHLAISLSALSPYLYTLFHPDTPRRYFLSLLVLPVLMVALLFSRGVSSRVLRRGGSHLPAWISRLTLLLTLLVGLAWIGHASLPLAVAYRNGYAQKDLDVAALLQRRGLRSGLSDFWGANLGAISDGALDVQPIAADGEPDLWAHNPEAYLAPVKGAKPAGDGRGRAVGKRREVPIQAGDVKAYSFVYLRRDEHADLVEDRIVTAYGEPSSRLGCRKGTDDYCVLLYEDDRRLRQVIAGKLARFLNRCVPRRNVR
jgi:hypothetical protein